MTSESNLLGMDLIISYFLKSKSLLPSFKRALLTLSLYIKTEYLKIIFKATVCSFSALKE